jgi:hypothetical protein
MGSEVGARRERKTSSEGNGPPYNMREEKRVTPEQTINNEYYGRDVQIIIVWPGARVRRALVITGR